MPDSTMLPEATAAIDAVGLAHRRALETVARRIATPDGKLDHERIDEVQLPAYELAISAAELMAARESLRFAWPVGREGRLESMLAVLFAAETARDVGSRLRARRGFFGFGDELGGETIDSPRTLAFVEEGARPEAYDLVAHELSGSAAGPACGLTGEQIAIAETFRRFADDVVLPLAERIHREDLLVPRAIFEGLRDLGAFGLSIPAAYGGVAESRPDAMGMVIVTEELSRGSLAAAGSLITRPEILARALLKGGTEEQKQRWLPRLASGEAIAAVAVTEPDHGSDVAGIKLAAVREASGDFLLTGVKTWCTFGGFANVLMVLARTDPRPESRHRGLSLFVVDKPSFEGREFAWEQPGGGRIEGRAIDTIGYRGMHSFELVFDGYRVPASNLVGGEGGLGKGFYLQMEGFSGGRLQTAARALGVMRAASERAMAYASERTIFGRPELSYGLTRFKLARMAALIQAARHATYRTARLVDEGGGQLEASMVKLFCCKCAEWVTREAMQIHGGMGYAEEFAVSRNYLDARVLSIFEGAEEVLALKVVAKNLLSEALS
ncbi:MAG: acyl-CoA/acyl-ACP dehydrogenase [Deltaproteobacteria bacterium]|nr:acyl-CoA/acyl-ACP dehydrogenase [Deltaproteobacteria bacterium]